MKVQKVNTLVRLTSMFVDYFLFCMLMVLLILPFGLLNLFRLMSHSPLAISESITGLSHQVEQYLFLVGFTIYICKDCINGRSIAKRIFKQQVINVKNSQPASPVRCIIRNLLMPFALVEVIFTVITPDRRLGDRIAGTRVAIFEKQSNEFSF